MGRVLISFLGLGGARKNLGQNQTTPAWDRVPGYDETTYEWNGAVSTKTAFAQTAIVELIGKSCRFDRIIVLCTKESREVHYNLLLDDLRRVGCDTSIVRCPEVLIPTDMRAQNQWQWFETVLAAIDDDDEVVFDFTHGMRAVPIVFSSAIGFLSTTRRLNVRHVIYAWYDRDSKLPHPLVDMRDFYVINDWSAAVSRLVEDADARKLAELARESKVDALEGLGAQDVVDAFQAMTDCIRNVDVNRISTVVNTALVSVERLREDSSGSARVLLDCVWEKFRHLASDYPPSGRYDAAYFKAQLEIIRVLNEHRLYMQSFTAMRELIASFGTACPGKTPESMNTSKGRSARRYGDVFVNMVQIRREKWDFDDKSKVVADTLLPWYGRLEEAGIVAMLKSIAEKREGLWSLTDYRNGFDHAWTSKATIPGDIPSKAASFTECLSQCVDTLVEKGLVETR